MAFTLIKDRLISAQGTNEWLAAQIDTLESRLANQLDTLDDQREIFETYREMQEFQHAELFAKALTIHCWARNIGKKDWTR